MGSLGWGKMGVQGGLTFPSGIWAWDRTVAKGAELLKGSWARRGVGVHELGVQGQSQHPQNVGGEGGGYGVP